MAFRQSVVQRIFDGINSNRPVRARAMAFLLTHLSPGFADGWVVRSRVHTKFVSTRSAEVVAREGLSHCPWSEKLYNSVALSLLQQGRVSDARDILLEGQEAIPNSALLTVGLASAYMREEDWERVEELSVKAEQQIHAGVPETATDELVALASVLLHVPGGRPSAARLLREAADRQNGDPRPHLLLSLVAEEDDPAEAAHQFEMASNLWRGSTEQLAREAEMMRDALAKS